MAFVDRVVQYPNRVKLTRVSGQTDVFDMTRQEGTVTTVGTPLNKKNLTNEIKALISSAMAKVNGALTIDASNNVKMRNIQCGNVVIKTASHSKENVKKHITFSTAFTSQPRVVATMRGGAPTSGSVSLKAVTTTGFDLYAYRTTNVDTEIDWIAIL